MPTRSHHFTSDRRESRSLDSDFQNNNSRRSTESNQARLSRMRREVVRVRSNAFIRQGLRPEVLEKALQAYKVAASNGETESSTFTIIDFELPSSQKRLWVIDVTTGELLHHEQVSHGVNSDKNNDGKVDPGGLSNKNRSRQSNIGLLKTAETYHSSKFKGTSLRMDGLEEGFNDNARDRSIVMHPADYADVRPGQKTGRSWGCPALDPDVSGDVIKTIKNGTLIFQYYPDPNWLRNSKYLNP